MAEKYQNKYRVPSSRAPWHGYNGGVYFVTICTQNREHYFGEITCCRDVARNVSTESQTITNTQITHCTDVARRVSTEPQMQLSPIGQYVHEQFVNVKTHYPYAEIPLFVIMPNHIHAIVVIDGGYDTDARCRDVARNVSTKNMKMANISPHKNSLSVVIRGIKSSITHFANTNNIPFAWQPRFHDHIVRNQDELNRIATYIENNVAQWQLDEYRL